MVSKRSNLTFPSINSFAHNPVPSQANNATMTNAVKLTTPSPVLREIAPEDLPVGEGSDPEAEAPEAPALSTAVG